jgi:RNA polymerase sigma factor (sigma-70 family)
MMTNSHFSTAVRRWLHGVSGQAMASLSDGQLLERFIRQRDEAAFATLLQRHGPLVLGVCRRLLGDVHDADDAFQATFLVLACRAAAIRRGESLASFLYGTAFRVARRLRGQKVRRQALHQQAARQRPEAATPLADDRETHALLHEELERLPRKHRDVLILCYLQGKTNEQAAHELGCPPGSMSRRLGRARELLRDRLLGRGAGVLAALVGPMLAEQTTAAMPSALVWSTVETVRRHGIATALLASSTPPAAVALARGVLHATRLTRLTIATTLLAAGLAVAGGATALHSPAAKQPPPEAKAPALPADQAARAKAAPRFDKLEKEIPAFGESPAGKLIVTVERGWLVARRQTKAGDLEWHIVLALATNPLPPKISIDRFSFISIEYGTYFIREQIGHLRVWRERKSPKSPDWIAPAAAPKQTSLSSAGGAGRTLFLYEAGDWCWMTGGPSEEKPDIRLRLQHKDLLQNSYGVTNIANDLLLVYCGDANCQDEGDLLIATRVPIHTAEAILLARKLRKEMKGKPAPELAAQQWLNTAEKLDLSKLKGKVVLLDFWGQWCSPCVEKLPQVEELHAKYKDKGLVVIGVHSADQSDKLNDFLKKKNITFPVMIDQGNTAKRYAIEGWPTYFLIEKTGTLAWGFAHNPPSAAQIEELLKK